MQPTTLTKSTTTPAAALWNNRHQIVETRDRLKALWEAVDWQNDLMAYQWIQWYAMTLEFKPDLIIELGRGLGNSTCVFTEAANQLGNCRVLSLCISQDWDARTKPRISEVVPPNWFDPLDARTTDILRTDVGEMVGNSQRILVLWDAHGFEIAGYVLGAMMPVLQHRTHLVIMHDISDARYISPEYMGYQGQEIWHGGNCNAERLVLGHFNSAVEQAIAILDFTSRNGLELHSSDHSLHTELNEQQALELQQLLGDPLFSRNGHWFWFSVNEKATGEPVHFPKFVPPAPPQPTAFSFTPSNDEAVLKQQLQQAQSHIHHLTARIAAMESSKFWKIRTAWAKLKQSLGLGGGD
jgi:cephalosporin hydroxylase